jgi:hypothetical protein
VKLKWDYEFPVGRKGGTVTTWVKSDSHVFVVVVLRRRLFRKPVLRLELHSETPMLFDETAAWDHGDVSLDNLEDAAA